MPQVMNLNTTGPATDEDWLRFGWNTFIAMNWPHLETGIKGQPDPTGDIVASYSDPETYPRTSWSTYNDKFQLVLPAAIPPGDWNNPIETNETISYQGSAYKVLGIENLSKAISLTYRIRDLFGQATSHNPLLDNQGRLCLYEIYMNESLWTYMQKSGYYDQKAQYAAYNINGTQASNFYGFPAFGDHRDPQPDGADWYGNMGEWARQGAMSVKIAWKQLSQDEIESGRFYIRKVYYSNNVNDSICSENGAIPDGPDDPNGAAPPITVGLMGMHILRLTPSTGRTWFWSSFEHVDAVNTNPSGESFLNNGDDCQYPANSGYTFTNSCQDAVADEPGGRPFPRAAPTEVSTGTWQHGLCDIAGYNSNTSSIYRIEEMNDVLTDPLISSINNEYQQALSNSPWQYYQQIGTIQPGSNPGGCFIPPNSPEILPTVPTGGDPDDNPWAQRDVPVNLCYMTNVTMESYTQYNFNTNSQSWADRIVPTTNLAVDNDVHAKRMSCINCHVYAAPYGSGYFDAGLIQPSNNAYPLPTDTSGNSYPSWDGMPTSNRNQVFTFFLHQARSSCTADVDLSGIVDIDDLFDVIDNWGDCPEYSRFCPTDVNLDNITDVADLLFLLRYWNTAGCE